ncbi:lanthionine synthetase LanC family protein [Streptomyces sp. NPDC003038]|uniref:lanthionine synthetase LanC family protein n=1 Tax=unclassified Streptomyces TaxID=2593676 RepID=UPI0033A3E581
MQPCARTVPTELPAPVPPAADAARDDVIAAARDSLGHWLRAGDQVRFDCGPALVAVLLHQRTPDDLTAEAMTMWLRRLSTAPQHPGLHNGGLAARLAGLRLLSPFLPALDSVAEQADATLDAAGRQGLWATEHVAFTDYDLISGPSGVLLAQSLNPDGMRRAHAVTAHLTRLCDAEDLNRLRIGAYRDDVLNSWCHGRVNTGLGHGVPGIAVALAAALRVRPGDGAVAEALARLTRWLIAHTEGPSDRDGMIRWPVADRRAAKPARRQAWCYGTPGIAWALHQAGRALERAGHPESTPARELARIAFRSVCRHYREEDHLVDEQPAGARLAVCHGSAGMLALTEAFCHTGGPGEAAALRARLLAGLTPRLDAVTALARTDMSLLTGAAGTLAVLLVTLRQADRHWMPLIGLE